MIVLLMRNFYEKYAELPKMLRRPLWRLWHRYILSRDKSMIFKFMNYGFAFLDENEGKLELEKEDEAERYCIQLYHHDVSFVPIKDMDILEVGCGRGGGASYITRYLGPREYIGLDISKKTIKYCNKFYNIPGLKFVHGHAEALPFEDNRFDRIVNVESSRCYPDVQQFLHEVFRCLKPKGYLLFSDMRTKEGLEELKDQFNEAGLTIIKQKDILANIVKALQLDNDRRKQLTMEKTPKFLHKSVHEFSGIVGSKRYQLFEDGTMGYHHFILQKAA